MNFENLRFHTHSHSKVLSRGSFSLPVQSCITSDCSQVHWALSSWTSALRLTTDEIFSTFLKPPQIFLMQQVCECCSWRTGTLRKGLEPLTSNLIHLHCRPSTDSYCSTLPPDNFLASQNQVWKTLTLAKMCLFPVLEKGRDQFCNLPAWSCDVVIMMLCLGHTSCLRNNCHTFWNDDYRYLFPQWFE